MVFLPIATASSLNSHPQKNFQANSILLTCDTLIPSTNISLERNGGPSRLDFIVAAIVADLSCGHHIDLHTKSLKAYGAAATAGLLSGLTDPKLRAVTLYALQHCWDPSALEPVATLLADPDLNTRQMAAIVVGKNAGLAELARVSKTLLDDQRPEIAGLAYERLEAVEPDLVRTEKIITQPLLWANISKFLPRYYSSSLTKHTRQMLGADNLRVVLPAIASLINQNDDSIETRTRIALALREVIPELRELSAEYLLWHGTLGEAGFLEEAIGSESDPYALAAMSCALEAIKRRNTSINNACKQASKTTLGEASAAYQHAIKILIDAPPPKGQGVRVRNLSLCRISRAVDRLHRRKSYARVYFYEGVPISTTSEIICHPHRKILIRLR